MITKYVTYFDIDNINVTPGALELFRKEGIKTHDILLLVEKHKFNDDENQHEEDLKQNVNAIKYGGMFLSLYHIGKSQEKIYIISYIEPEQLKSLETTILLASEY